MILYDCMQACLYACARTCMNVGILHVWFYLPNRHGPFRENISLHISVKATRSQRKQFTTKLPVGMAWEHRELVGR